MEKYFNTTGLCIENKHYMVNIDNKISKIKKLISRDKYFIINRPRQYGKTTILNKLKNELLGEYIVISISFEGLGDLVFQEEYLFCNKFLTLMCKSLRFSYKEYYNKLNDIVKDIHDLDELSDIITEFIESVDKEVILIIDEVDKSSNNQLFLSFLGMLRNKYLSKEAGCDYTFKSVILAGVHDIKNLKLKIRNNDEKKLNSPWNIAVDFDIDMSFSTEEIETMLNEYRILNNVDMDETSIAEKIYFYTSGYPFLVSKICQIVDEYILEEIKRPWEIADIDLAVKELLKTDNTLFDDLIKNIENDKEIYEFIENIIISGYEIPFTLSDLVISKTYMYGIIKNYHDKCKVNNKVFELYIYNHMTAKINRQSQSMNRYNFRENFINENGSLNIELVLVKFQQFMKEQYSNIDANFIEREGRLLFLAFIKPIINGVGFDFKEVQI
ncbi:MAG: AAA family ATPase, partial [Romboutsia sp.]